MPSSSSSAASTSRVAEGAIKAPAETSSSRGRPASGTNSLGTARRKLEAQL